MAEIGWTEWAGALAALVFGGGVLWIALKVTEVYEQIPKWENRKYPVLLEVIQKLEICLDAVPKKEATEQLQKIGSRCASCTHLVECRSWLSGELSNNTFRSFCPNTVGFEFLRYQQLAA